MARPFADYRSFAYQAGGSSVTAASPEAVWSVVTAIGGRNRYYALNFLWTIREWMDALIGGEGLRHGRATTGDLKPGDRIDSWTVLVADRPRVLALIFGMKAPGHGVLEFRIAQDRHYTRLTATAFWDADGLAGRLYWRAMQPAHLVLFNQLTREICRRAHEGEAGNAQSDPSASQDSSNA